MSLISSDLDHEQQKRTTTEWDCRAGYPPFTSTAEVEDPLQLLVVKEVVEGPADKQQTESAMQLHCITLPQPTSFERGDTI